jgi:hypothetical protein
MSKIKSNLAATVLTLLLTVPALAGNIGSPGCTEPPPPPPSTTSGNIGSPGSPAPALVDFLIAVLSLI